MEYVVIGFVIVTLNIGVTVVFRKSKEMPNEFIEKMFQ